MKTVIIIQARMGSTRLPGKVMKILCGRPILWHVLQRVKACKNAGQIVIATTENKEDDVIAKFCDAQNVVCFRGSEQDVLSRYYLAAKENSADTVVRITADCPLVDPEITDNMIRLYSENKDMYCGVSNVIKRTYPRGLDCEVFSFEALERLYHNTQEPRYREHVTLYMYEHSSDFPLFSIISEKNLSHYRLTVDEADDFVLIKKIYEAIYSDEEMFNLNRVIEYLEKHPELSKINSLVQQKVYK